LIAINTSACAEEFSDEKMQPLAATAFDLARVVRLYAVNNPDNIANLDDQELVRKATAYDPSLMGPYEGFIVRGLPSGVVLVCSADGKHGLIEDAACSPVVDSMRWKIEESTCEFQVNLDEACK